MNEADYIKTCLQQIEAQLDWGPSQQWVNYDFEKLSSCIQEKTQVILSITTLKRIWGKVKYASQPTVTTLNVLARFLDYPDWRSFVQSTNLPAKSKMPIRLLPIISITSFLLLIAGTLLIFSTRLPKRSISLPPYKFQFSANKVVSTGVPNSVVFNYDASAATTDSVFIVQTWDIRRRALVSKDKKAYSAIYYYPGFFRTKLIIDSQVVKEHDLMIATDGWLGLIEQNPVPVYLSTEECQTNDGVAVSAAQIEAHEIKMEPHTPKLRFFNMHDMGTLKNDDFIFETKLKNDFRKGAGACQLVQVLIQCKDDIIIIPLSAKACVGDLNLYFAGAAISSLSADLSKFGCDLNSWTTLRVESKNGQAKIFVNSALAYQLAIQHPPTGIVGLQYRFEGTGAVKDTWISGGGKTYRF
jgi:hypothetical protein